MRVIPAVMPRTWEDLEENLQRVASFATEVQIDIVDGEFDDDVTWPFIERAQWPEMERLGEGGHLPLRESIEQEVHLMVREPEHLGVLFLQGGARRLIAHLESFDTESDARRILAKWREAGAQVGIALLLDTELPEVYSLVSDVDVVQLMGIAEIGAQGHMFDERTLARVRDIRTRFPHASIAVDGGVNLETAPSIVKAGADRLAVGSAIMGAEDPRIVYEQLALLQARIL